MKNRFVFALIPFILVCQYTMQAHAATPVVWIEAETSTLQAGMQTETCADGGLDVGWIHDGNYLAYYKVDFGNGMNHFQARVASEDFGGTIEIHLDSETGALLSTLNVISTGGWQNWVTKDTAIIQTAGVHTVYLVFHGSGRLFNINWFKLSYDTPPKVFSQIEAEASNLQSGTRTEPCAEGGLDVGWIHDGNYRAYFNLNFGNGPNAFLAQVASDSEGGTIEIHLASPTGTIIGTLPVTNTGGWQKWVVKETAIIPTTGMQALYLVFHGYNYGLFNLNWFKFAKHDSSQDSFSSGAKFVLPEADTHKIVVGIETKVLTDFGNPAELKSSTQVLQNYLRRFTAIPLEWRLLTPAELQLNFQQGKLDFVVTYEIDLDAYASQGLIKPMATLVRHGSTTQPCLLIARNQDPIRCIQDLRGKRLGYSNPQLINQLGPLFFCGQPSFSVGTFFSTTTCQKNVRDSLYALQMESVDVVVEYAYILDIAPTISELTPKKVTASKPKTNTCLWGKISKSDQKNRAMQKLVDALVEFHKDPAYAKFRQIFTIDRFVRVEEKP